MTSEQLSFADESEEYRAFVEKFKPKKTTDDCCTPPEIYEVVLDWVVDRYGIDRDKVVRPFWPGGDYEREEYPEGCAVVDNPPFSILSRICGFYMEHGVSFFLFCPSLTALSASGRRYVLETNHIIPSSDITYENGAVVRTAFVTNLDTDGTVLESAPDLGDLINAKDDELQRAKRVMLPKYIYPDNVITSARVQWLATHHTPYKVHRDECVSISSLDAQNGKSIFGGGLLLSTRAAAERAAAERAAVERAAAERAAAERAAVERAAAERAAAHRWELSENERAIVKYLDKRGES